ncbi:helix-turn-helix transcriptional regulator [Novosphingobium mangrovi (ex Hu et al. 2023)]|uniref:AraC family transcriptional regulator n=1 Tax=Novosphingobium mangrovi (ex Hu et al. 2023) TaxID=2930094 RepID=A0ABT0AAH5_9SPHN|nr:AraC family transcriptional regulator [Novosphingobium mangrovi (ex Hu et al. 2023)]MCJ1960201.1 AraC family transcriptional regulator [Novosphingobium mangrovi (ex Hu et al. 2023)]
MSNRLRASAMDTWGKHGTASKTPDVRADRRMCARFVRSLDATLERPSWLLAGAGLDRKDELPETIRVGQYITIMSNMARHAPDPAYFIDFLEAGVPYFRGGIDLATRYAPDIRSAFAILPRFANERPGIFEHRLSMDARTLTLELDACMPLGDARPILTGAPLLFLARVAAANLGRPVHEARIELRHREVPYAARLRAAFRCRVDFAAPRDAITLPRALALCPSVTHDPAVWTEALARCEAEVEPTRPNSGWSARTRGACCNLLTSTGRVPRLEQVAGELGVSARTLIRHLKAEDTRFHALVDVLLQERSQALLRENGLAIRSVAEQLGLSDASDFNRRFRRWFGMTPSQYRAQALPPLTARS